MKFIRLTLVLSVWCVFPPSCLAKYLRADTEKVPIDRLVANLERQIQTRTNAFELHYAVARVHSMAYASKDEALDARKEDGRPFFGYGPSAELPPGQPTKAGNAGREQIARQHLAKAIEHYRKASELNASHLPSLLGLGWCLEQSDNKAAAIGAYRKALAQAWEKESKEKHLFEISMTAEAAKYLLPLLDPKQDAAEIEKVKRYQTDAEKFPRAITPVIIPLLSSVTLADLVDPDAKVAFDLDGSGLDRPWGWITPQAAWLVYDHDGRGEISSGLQLFGGVTFWIFWQNGYRALASLDANGDGVLRGDELKGLALWHDANGNGVSEPGEVKPLAAWGISALSCEYQTHATGIPFSPRGVVFQDGSTRPSYDWIAPRR